MRYDDFSGEEVYRAVSTLGDEVAVFVNCIQGGPLLSVFLMDGTFRDGDIDMRWDEGTVELHVHGDRRPEPGRRGMGVRRLSVQGMETDQHPQPCGGSPANTR